MCIFPLLLGNSQEAGSWSEGFLEKQVKDKAREQCFQHLHGASTEENTQMFVDSLEGIRVGQ